MPQITLVDSEFCTNNDDMIRHVVNNDDRASGHLYRDRIEKKICPIVIVRHVEKKQYPLLHHHHRLLRTVSHP